MGGVVPALIFGILGLSYVKVDWFLWQLFLWNIHTGDSRPQFAHQILDVFPILDRLELAPGVQLDIRCFLLFNGTLEQVVQAFRIVTIFVDASQRRLAGQVCFTGAVH